jgi:AraC-like DNA-binding protein
MTAALSSMGGVTYREWQPPPELRSHVACVWANNGGVGAVLPDGCVDVVWTGSVVVVAGPSTRAFVPAVEPGETTVGVRFRVGAAGTVLGLPVGQLVDRSPRLAAVVNQSKELEARCAEATSASRRLLLLTAAVGRLLADARPVDPLVRAGITELRRPAARVVTLDLGMSVRQLRRRFDHGVGYSPKMLARVLRFQRFLGLSRSRGGLARLAVEAGYADQSHLTNDCTALSGRSPAALLATEPVVAGEAALRSG